jgi:putative nucleotidyltransferase with HDIG domain
MTETVDVSQLRVGMFVHLDVGWMAHPFPLSSFKIASAEQIQTIQGLGLKQLRWSPERSDPTPVSLELATRMPASEEPPPPDPAELARRERAVRLEAQLDAMRQCERQFSEACRDLRRINDSVVGEPEQAREATRQLSQALMDKMLVDGELCVRVLGDQQGDRLSAHVMNVTVISMLLGKALGFDAEAMLALGTGALLHDVGKLGLPDRLRLGHDNFTASEQQHYREHVALGVVQGRRMGLSPQVLLVIAQHHELADASGYPSGVGLDKMSEAARVVSMVNHYDNLCNAAAVANSLTPHEALSRMFAHARGKFDAVMLNAFIRLMGIYPPGSLVQLSDDRLAMVMSVNSARPLKPRVLVMDPGVPSELALHLDLEQVPDLGIRRSLRSDQLPGRALDYLAPRKRVAYFFDVETPSLEQA